MPFFIPIAIGVAVAGVAAAGAAGAVIKKRHDKKKRQRENAVQKPVEWPQHQVIQPHVPPAQRPRRQQSQTVERSLRPRTQPGKQEQHSTRQPQGNVTQHQPPQSPKAPEHRQHTRSQPCKLPPYDKQSLVKALDTAIANTARDTLGIALVKPPFNHMSPHEQKQRVSTIADDMRSKLGGLQTPDYGNDIVAAAYLLNYHPSHIGLAHTIVNQMVNSRGGRKLIAGDSGHLHIVDLAAGTLAMQFGIAIAVADALIRGEDIKRVVVDSIDISQVMLRVGRIAWEKFVLDVQSDESLTALAEACQVIETHRYVLQDAAPERDGECWLSCLHGVYQQNSDGLKQSLHALQDKHRPIVGLLSCWGKALGDRNVAIAQSISPFVGENWKAQPAYFLEKGSEYRIPFLFQNRENDAPQTVEMGRRSGILPPTWSVFWRPSDTAILTYHRYFSDHAH